MLTMLQSMFLRISAWLVAVRLWGHRPAPASNVVTLHGGPIASAQAKPSRLWRRLRLFMEASGWFGWGCVLLAHLLA